MTDEVPARPSATVVLLRDGAEGLEVLLVRRAQRLSFHGGAWVFPGGRVDRADHEAARGDDDALGPARRAAVREVAEEAGLTLGPEALAPFAHWTTPVGRPKRFSTWFFVAHADASPSREVRVDGGEIHAHRWLVPVRAIEERDAGRIALPPPTFVTLWYLRRHARSEDALRALRAAEPERFFPRQHRIEGGMCSLYHGDAGYETGDPGRPGPRHRLVMVEPRWRYERSDGSSGGAP